MLYYWDMLVNCSCLWIKSHISQSPVHVNCAIQFLNSGSLGLLLSRPTYLSADLGFTAIIISIYLSLHPLPSELAGRNSTKTDHMLGIECDLKTHVRNLGVSFPLQIEGSEPPFSTTSQRNGNFNAYIFGTKHDKHNQASVWKLQGVSYIASKRHELWLTDGLILDLRILHSASLPGFADGDQQTKLNQTSPIGGQWIALG